MPRKTRKQYKKKTKRGGMNIANRMRGMTEGADKTMRGMTKGANNTMKKIGEKTTGFFKFPKFSLFGKKTPQDGNKPPQDGNKPPQDGNKPESPLAPPVEMQQPSKPMGGKRKSRRFIKKKGKVTLQGGRRRRSRKSKTRCRTRRRR